MKCKRTPAALKLESPQLVGDEAHSTLIPAGVADEDELREAAALEAPGGQLDQHAKTLFGERDGARASHVSSGTFVAPFRHVRDDRRDDGVAEGARDFVGRVGDGKLVL